MDHRRGPIKPLQRGGTEDIVTRLLNITIVRKVRPSKAVAAGVEQAIPERIIANNRTVS